MARGGIASGCHSPARSTSLGPPERTRSYGGKVEKQPLQWPNGKVAQAKGISLAGQETCPEERTASWPRHTSEPHSLIRTGSQEG
ncbi:GL26923 [Drosophila persimilis]|uniref:GL26923 n=1 Tax=Drosophila persimilis TaxID=7234 RepID=B4H2W9_DROPE|nr:GL26923 [Drosophila persimilis]